VIFRHLQTCPDHPEPLAVVPRLDRNDPVCLRRSRVVFSQPVLLPEV
jgi:hypothetical protein